MPAAEQYVLLLFLIFYKQFRETSYLKISGTDLCLIFRVVGTMAVDDYSEISFLVCQETLPWQPKMLISVHECHWTQAASALPGGLTLACI